MTPQEKLAAKTQQSNCSHCWHRFRGPLLIVLQDGETVQSCCKCHEQRVVHVDHSREYQE